MVWLSMAAWAGSVNVDEGAVVSGGDRAVSPTSGISVDIPAGQTGQLTPDAFVIGTGDVVGRITIEPDLTVDQVLSVAGQGFMVGSAQFQLARPPIQGRTSAEVMLEGQGLFGGAQVGLGQIRPSAAGTVILVVTGPSTDEGSVKGLYAQLSGSLEVGEVASAPPTRAPRGAWAEELSGRAIHSYDSRGTSSSRMTVDLCSDGTLFYSASSSYHTAVGDTRNVDVSGAQSSNERGHWVLNGDQITATWSDGSTQVHQLSKGPKGELLLDGERWLRDDSERCR